MSTNQKAKRGRPKKEMLQVHGKDESALASNVPTSLDDILGESLSHYTAKSSEEYQAQLADMNMTDLQSHAYKVGLIPTEDRRVLVERLTHEFNRWISRYGITATVGNVTSIQDLDKKALKILREGA